MTRKIVPSAAVITAALFFGGSMVALVALTRIF
jgi:hypothetical protein